MNYGILKNLTRMKTLLTAAALLVCIFTIFAGTGEAKGKIHRLTNVTSDVTEIDGRAALHIEIETNRTGLSYALSQRYRADNRLVIDIEDVEIGKNLPQEIALDGTIAQKLVLAQREDHRAVLRIYTAQSLAHEDAYRLRTVPGDAGGKTKEKLVIDIFADGGKALGTAVRGHTVVLDPGHGGSDSGAVGYSGIREKDVALAVALQTESLLRAAGANVVMTRTRDADVSDTDHSPRGELQARVDVAAGNPRSELFLSIHCNAFTNPDAHGMETYYYPKTDNDERFARLLNEELETAGGLFNRGVKYAKFYVLRHTEIPASLVEMGFLSNPEEEALLGSADYQKKMAEALFRAIVRYFE
ncbi:N-acetylmuramoyl-L-alanine amidase family protein [Selenomonas sp. F0473]|uniref:N-acetylmuramoyl-L-alanine amidase family protein n=1 Tax=Selenomonas sp. F0473 TaxID=999423 RepID=UPI0025ED7196|nr:N-acetylmuramoyl-L-alanine amidase [Selenomonas sp. F0473]